jgi:hypothetical protein
MHSKISLTGGRLLIDDREDGVRELMKKNELDTAQAAL